MKKYLVIVMALVAILGFSVAAHGQLPITETVDVYAEVACYATLDVTSQPGTLYFTGAPNEVKETTFTTTKESNCLVYYKGEVTTPLTGPGGATISTETALIGYTPYGSSWVISNPAQTIWHDTIGVRGTLGPSVISQPAGSYSGVITLTVYEP